MFKFMCKCRCWWINIRLVVYVICIGIFDMIVLECDIGWRIIG